ncbi:HAD-IC family P-type ATPase [Marispirochaeta aestuarii]|uniref:HAD-IC family P-type ATPase n=1 Tax=Marispirochaeta aestuarii TaxID=1963862 RepID=UPI002ABDC835|nr:HAD-IC family P-type ATPase [Marispirochaeta aestuarii]
MLLSPGILSELDIEVPGGTDKGSETRVFLLVDEILSGDNEQTAVAVADELGVDGCFARILSDQKQEKIRELQEQGEYVAMTGDGVNDSPALAQAQVGIAVGSGTDVAAATADIILVNSNPLDVSALILFGRAIHRKMVQNLIWATGYNVVAIPLAGCVLFSPGDYYVSGGGGYSDVPVYGNCGGQRKTAQYTKRKTG